MAQVTIKINGYAYIVGCEDGQEAHLQAMAGEIETRIEQIRSIGGQSGEARLLVLAGLLMADELHDLRRTAPAGARPLPGAPDPHLRTLADRAEHIAAALEHD
jgi:cell division protein ZapA